MDDAPLAQTGRMPFTPSHMAAALPFVRTPLISSAIAIGTMTPDLFYYVPVDVPREYSHSWAGVFTVDLVFGVALFLLWQLVLRAPVIDFAPFVVRSRMKGTDWIPVGRLRYLRLGILLPASLLLGSATHVVWDLFTHAGPFADGIPLLAATYGPFLGSKWLQHASSLLGAVALLVFAGRWLSTKPAVQPASTRLTSRTRAVGWGIAIAAGLIVSLAVFVPRMLAGESLYYSSAIFQAVTYGLAAAGLAVLVVCLVWWYSRRRADGPRHPSDGLQP